MRRSSSTLARATVCGQFSSQLRVLRSRIEMTEPHYIRCLKPNDRLVADSFDRSLISHQLNCAGVLPAMKIARAGFAMRYLHSAFDQRFSPIVNKQVACLSYRRLKQADRTKKLVELLAPTLEAAAAPPTRDPRQHKLVVTRRMSSASARTKNHNREFC